jgi:hypothetical protein
MTDSGTPTDPGGGLRDNALVVVICAALVVATQLRAGCFSAEFGDDEASHYVSGLLIYDYLRSGLSQGPISYLKWYHSHYPLVGIGHWGPVFYGIEALWMAIFSASRVSVLLLSASLTTATALLIYRYGTVHLRLRRMAAGFAAVAFVISPIAQEGSSAVMLDIPITFCAMLALFAYTRYVLTERWIYSALFGLVAGAAMLIKGNGALLALLPPFAVVFARKWRLILRPSFWASAVIAGVMAAPWYLVTYGQVSAGFRYSWGLDYLRTAVTLNSEILYSAVRPLVLLLAAAGLLVGWRRTDGAALTGYTSAAALLAAVWVFQSVAPAAIQDRYLAPLLPSLFMLAALGVVEAARLVSRWLPGGSRRLEPLVMALAVLSLLPSALAAERKQQQGFRELAQVVWANRNELNPVVLVVARNSGEAAALAELAMADPARPSLFAVRGSRLLGGGGYNRQDYMPKFADASQVASEINAYNIPLVLYQADPGGWEHVAQVESIRIGAKVPWQVLGVAGAANAPVTLYKLLQANGRHTDIKRLLELTGPRTLEKSAVLGQ